MQLINPFENRRSRFAIPKEIKTPILISLLLASITSLATLVLYPQLQPTIPLFYSLSLLEQQLVSKQFIFILPGLSLGFFMINVIFSQFLSRIDMLMMQMMSWATLLFNFLLLFAFFRIIVII